MGLNLKRTAQSEFKGRGSSSGPKGVQQKWYDPVNRVYYKLDSNGNHEGLVECIVGEVIENTSLDGKPIPYTKYWLEDINGSTVSVSKSFLERGDRELSFMNIINNTPELLSIEGDTQISVDIKICSIVKNIARVFAVKDLCSVYGAIMLLDYVLLNEDRHWGNVSIIQRGTHYQTAPVFDTGNALRCSVIRVAEARKIYEPRPYNAYQLYALPELMGDSKIQICVSAMDFANLHSYLCKYYPASTVERYLSITRELLHTCTGNLWAQFLEVF